MNAPIIIFVYNRYKHAKETIEALLNNEGIDNSDIYIYSDGPKDEIDAKAVEEVRLYIWQQKKELHNCSITIIEQEKNIGLEKSVINGVTEVINKFGKAIVLEDDIITSPDFLCFMNGALDAFENDAHVWSISGYSLDNRQVTKSQEDVLWTYRGSCWGWASWSDRWNRVDWEVTTYSRFKHSLSSRKKFNRGGRDMSYLLDLQMNGQIHSWAIRWCYQQFLENQISIYPRFPKALNDGFDGSGTNCSISEFQHSNFKIEKQWLYSYNLKNKRLIRAFNRSYWLGYWRGKIGAVWYLIFVNVHRIVYRSENQEWKVLKPRNGEWYCNPTTFVHDSKIYLFVSIYDVLKKTFGVGICQYNECGILERPKRIGPPMESMEYSSMFTYLGKHYLVEMVPSEKQVRIYAMKKDVFSWSLFKCIDVKENESNPVIIGDEQNGITLLMAEHDSSYHRNMSRLVQYELRNFFDESKKVLKPKFVACDEFSYKDENVGYIQNPEKKEMYRVTRINTETERGRNIFLSRITKINSLEPIKEKYVNKISLYSLGIQLPQYIYRPMGIYGYSFIDKSEFVDVYLQKLPLIP